MQGWFPGPLFGPETDSDLTVVITNWRRPEFLPAAFQSCLEAGVENIVVTSSAVDESVKRVHAQMQSLHPGTVILTERGDSGSNANWLRGVDAAKTEWVQILHDDDLLLPEYRLVKHLIGVADFLCWDATTHGDVVGLNSRTFPGLSHGLHRATEIIQHLLQRSLSPSPVAGYSAGHT